ncbi:MAG: hydrolase or metal-binding protein [Methylophilaceae bacterium]|nr:hydrolase or metal-binding protein [Methylophilaceae bacterium]
MHTPPNIMKGLAITTPVIGRIMIGKRIERNGKLLPARDDSITLTTQIKRGQEWIEHPLQKEMESDIAVREGSERKLRSIPVTVLYNRPELNFHAEYVAFSQDGRPLCVGNGERARRFVPHENDTDDVICEGPQHCGFAKSNRCKAHGRLLVKVEGQEDELGAFMFRTASFNSINHIAFRLAAFHALCNGKLVGLPMTLKLRAKSTAMSMGTPVYFMDLVIREGMTLKEAAKTCYDYQQDLLEAGLDLNSFESSVTAGLQNSLFHDADEMTPEPLEDELEEAYPDSKASVLQKGSGGLEALLTILNQNQEAAPSVDPGNMDHLDESALVISQINPYVLSPVTMQPTVDGAEASNGNK